MSENSVKKGGLLSPEELSAFCLQLSYPIQSGIGPADCIGLLLEETESRGEKEILSPVYAQMMEGAPLAKALEATGRFPDYMVHMIDIGQSSGNLDKVLEGLVVYYRKEAEMAAGLKRAATGPAVMLGVMSILLLVLVIKVLPVFNQVFQQMGSTLSPFALALTKASDVIQVVMPIIGALLLVFAVVIFVMLRGKSSAATISGIADKLFFRGKLGLAMARTRFCSAMNLTISSGMTMDEALAHTEKLLKDSPLGPAIAECRKSLEGGEPFPSAVQKAGIIVGIEAGILKTGFRAGSFDRAIAELATRYQTQSDGILERFITRIEPTLIVILSVTVGLALLSVMLPLIGMLSSIGV